MAFNDAYDDYEQSEYVRQWLRANAAAIIGGIVLGLLVIFGLHTWRTHQATHRMEAASHYAQMQAAVESGNTKAAASVAAVLQDQYKDTPFAVFAAMQKARLASDADKPADAVRDLAWARQHAGDEAIKSLIALRSARLELAQGHADKALAQLDALPAKDYQATVLELRGDALVALKRDTDARKTYEQALAAYDPASPQRSLVQIKLDNLAAAGKQGT
ncbi:MAG TPA: tetratricopeptide repeat protein [Rhodanobacteraceae bacterium]|nr:tetratricopeptide repeat protein [Rhodanobacteraceae bacterium]